MNSGLQVVFSQSIPHIVETRARENIEAFLQEYNLALPDVDYLIFHPGGAKVINAYETALRTSNGALQVCRDVLRQYGNMSAVSVLFVLEEHLRRFDRGTGKYGLVSALGPGFCAENVLIKF